MSKTCHRLTTIGIVRLQCCSSMNKARKLGWHGFVDSTECIFEVFQDFEKLKMIPPVPVSKEQARF